MPFSDVRIKVSVYQKKMVILSSLSWSARPLFPPSFSKVPFQATTKPHVPIEFNLIDPHF
jgi:hypothetical protein